MSLVDIPDWIDGFDKDTIFFHVGAEAGCLAIRAAKRGAFVQAFEPESQAYANLCWRTHLEDLNRHLRCWNIALTDRPGLHTLHVSDLEKNLRRASFKDRIDNYLQHCDDFDFEQSCGGMTLDFFAEEFGSPTHLLIDVGGQEHLVIKGGIITLKDTRLKSVVVWQNMNLVEHALIHPILAQCGFAPVDLDAVNTLSETNPEENLRYIVYNRVSEPKQCQSSVPFYRKTPMLDSSTTSLTPTNATTS
jgi:FkbM family methyltransferase